MPTIFQLPSSDTVSASDLIPISQDGSAHSVSVGALLAATQPAIIISAPSLLGRYSIGPGGPDTIAVGDGLTLNSGTLSSSSFDLSLLPLETNLSANDQIVVTNTGTSHLVGLQQIRGLFTAGPNITIDLTGLISASSSGTDSYTLTSLSSITALASGDLIGVNQNGQDHTISYANLIDGLTIDQALAAAPASDSDTFWIAQTGNNMLRQTLGALWPWVSGKLPSWKRPVIELSGNTALDGTMHCNATLICSSPILITAGSSSLTSGFVCQVINTSPGTVTFSANVITSNGSGGLSPYQCGEIQCATYSGGTSIYASISAGTSATTLPGQGSGLVASPITSTTITLSWSAPTSGGAASAYSVQYRVSGTTPWLVAGQTSGALSFAISGLQASTGYDLAITASNNVGSGPISSVLVASTTAVGIMPGAPTSVTLSNITANSMTCSWTSPSLGGTGVVYRVQYRVTGQSSWISAASNLSATTLIVSNLTPASSYDFEVTASSSGGSGPPSSVVTASTTQVAGLVTSITWALVPTGSFASGTGSIGVNAHVTPASASLQFGFSTSSTAPPTSWFAAVHVNSDLWGQYVPTPATAGSWYGWAEGTDGSLPTVYPTPFTVT